jgi:hypothetical protein
MIGERYWATGITVCRGYSGDGRYGWMASLDFYDDGFCEDLATQGQLATRYYVRAGDDPLGLAIDTLKADAERLGIRFEASGDLSPGLWYRGDGDNPDYPPPAGWRDLLAAQAERIGWRTYHAARST